MMTMNKTVQVKCDEDMEKLNGATMTWRKEVFGICNVKHITDGRLPMPDQHMIYCFDDKFVVYTCFGDSGKPLVFPAHIAHTKPCTYVLQKEYEYFDYEESPPWFLFWQKPKTKTYKRDVYKELFSIDRIVDPIKEGWDEFTIQKYCLLR